MRVVAMAILTGAVLGSTAPAQAQTYDPTYPVCMHVFGRVGYFDCTFTSLPQCNATASGRSASCLINPYYIGRDPTWTVHRRHRR